MEHVMKDNDVGAQGDGRNIHTLCWKPSWVSGELEEAHVLSREAMGVVSDAHGQ